VWERVASLATPLKEEMAARPGVELITPLEADRSAGLVTFKLRSVPAPEAARLLTERYRVVGRWVPRPDAVRLSVHLFNTEDEVERVLEAIDGLVAGGRRERGRSWSRNSTRARIGAGAVGSFRRPWPPWSGSWPGPGGGCSSSWAPSSPWSWSPSSRGNASLRSCWPSSPASA